MSPSPAGRGPRRIQRRRTAGWRMPSDAVYVGRPSLWGNPLPAPPAGEPARTPADRAEARRAATEGFRAMLADPGARAASGYPSDEQIRDALAGRDLACWCPPTDPCHADVLLDVANGPDTTGPAAG